MHKSLSQPTQESEQTSLGQKRRQRKWAPKVRTGCAICRARHVKCDEAKPSCNNCVRIGKRCQSGIYGSYDYELSRITAPPLKAQPGQVLWPTGIVPTARDKQTFDFFRSEVASQLGGLSNQPFWIGDMMRAMQSYPAIWHANLAMAAMQRWATCNTDPGASRTSVLQHYEHSLGQFNASIKHLSIIAKAPKLTYVHQEIMLLSSAVFVRLSTLQGDFAGARRHATTGLRLFHQWQFWKQENLPAGSRPDCLISVGPLVSTFSFMQNRFVEGSAHGESIPRRLKSPPQRCSKSPYATCDDAYRELQGLSREPVNGTSYHSSSPNVMGPVPPPAAIFDYRHELVVWMRKFWILPSIAEVHNGHVRGSSSSAGPACTLHSMSLKPHEWRN